MQLIDSKGIHNLLFIKKSSNISTEIWISTAFCTDNNLKCFITY